MLYPAKGGAASSCTISDALAEHAGRNGDTTEDRADGVRGDAVVSALPHAGDGAEGGADDEGCGDDAVDVDPHLSRDLRVLRGGAQRGGELRAIHEQCKARR